MGNRVSHEIDAVLRFASAINAHDVDAICALMTEDHHFIDSLGETVSGRETLRSAWKSYFGMVPDYAIRIESSLQDGESVVLLGEASGSFHPDGGSVSAGRWSTPAAWRVRIRGGAVAEWRVYADNEPLRRLMRRQP